MQYLRSQDYVEQFPNTSNRTDRVPGWRVFCVSVILLTGMEKAFAETVWRGDFKTHDLSQWTGALNPKKGTRDNIVVVDSPKRKGEYAAQVTIHPDDIFPNGHNRVELHYDGKRTAEGQTTYFSWWFQIPDHARVHEDIGYWETLGPEYKQTMAFYVDPKDGGTQLAFRTNHPTAREHWKTTLSPNEWHQIAMKIVWSQDPALGRVSVWYDGTSALTDVPARTKPNAANLFVQVGFHRDATQPFTESIYIDDAKEGTMLDDVLFVRHARE